ncbi:MAG TPA: type I-U CRISPR-associated protein Csb2 [Pirellulales bacterium]|jgi:CRISPR-associated protein Csb2|nr:type I-U CRISPR-associated protein Csb2 [Pirellulales bacterium]
MPSFSFVIEYLTGYAVATDPANRERAEWPPHPARVFMALAAAHFEADSSDASQRDALEWLAALDAPSMAIPQQFAPRDVLTNYVPVNDMQPGKLRDIEAIDWAELTKHKKQFDDKKKSVAERLGTIPSYRFNKQPRTFPRVHVGNEPLRLTWEYTFDGSHHLDALEIICRNVTRVGHSSSLVWVRLERDASVEPTHVPDDHALEKGVRIARAGALRRLDGAFNKSAIDEFVALEEQIGTSKGKAKKQLQEKLEERFPQGQPTSQRPVFSISQGYRPVTPPPADVVASSFDPNFTVLRESDDARQTFGLESTALLTDSLRKLIMQQSSVQPVPSWVGGHESNGDKLTSQNHMALIPLAFVGSRHADGHLMGVGVMLPRDLSYRERANVFSPILFDENTNEPKTLELKLGRAGVWKIDRETGTSPKQTLQTPTYTAPSLSWATVTPILLDRMPKTDRVKDPNAWREEVAGIISLSCQRVGLPEPVAVRVEKTPFFRGSLRAMPGQGGFPQLRKDKFQVHVALEFDQPVQGPVLLGAGRFRGYGLMRPWKSGDDR